MESMVMDRVETAIDWNEGVEEWVSVDDLFIDTDYQRSLSQYRLHKFGKRETPRMKGGFDVILAGAIIAHLREDGNRYVIDGQHRLEYARLCGIEKVRCVTFIGLTPEQEAYYFEELNTLAEKATALDRFRSRLKRGEPVAVQINECIERHGYKLASHRSLDARSLFDISSVSALDRLHELGGKPLVDGTFRVINRAWKKESHLTRQQQFILAVGWIVYLHVWRREISEDKVVAKLTNISPRTLRARASEYISASGVIAMYKSMIDAINKGARGDALLEQKPLRGFPRDTEDGVTEVMVREARLRVSLGEDAKIIQKEWESRGIKPTTAREAIAGHTWTHVK